MENIKTKGLVLRQTNYSESDRILTIFTEELGIVSAIVRGARKYRSHQLGAAQILCFGTFNLYRGRSMYTVRGAVPLENFYAIGSEIEKLALAMYLCDLTHTLVSDDNPDVEALRFLLNTLYILAYKERPLPVIKAVFELKIAEICGFGAQCSCCVRCGTENGLYWFSVDHGGLMCDGCIGGQRERVFCVHAALGKALRYICEHDAERAYAFDLAKEELQVLSDLAEQFVLRQADRNFQCLQYYKSVMKRE